MIPGCGPDGRLSPEREVSLVRARPAPKGCAGLPSVSSRLKATCGRIASSPSTAVGGRRVQRPARRTARTLHPGRGWSVAVPSPFRCAGSSLPRTSRWRPRSSPRSASGGPCKVIDAACWPRRSHAATLVVNRLTRGPCRRHIVREGDTLAVVEAAEARSASACWSRSSSWPRAHVAVMGDRPVASPSFGRAHASTTRAKYPEASPSTGASPIPT